jgi:CBS domain-containing protein
MTSNPKACSPSTNLAAAAELMWTKDCGILPVVDDAGKVTGIVTDRDMLIALGTRNLRPSELTVGEVMMTPVATRRANDDVDTALSQMEARQIRRLPVVSETGALIGMLTMNDIVLHSNGKGKGTAVPYDHVMMTLKGICDHGQLSQLQPS